MSLTTRVLFALVAGLGLGLVVSSTGNPTLVTMTRWIEPLGTLFINGIRMTVIPLVVGSLVAGIASAPNPSALGKIGVRALAIFIVTLFAGAIAAALIAPPVFALFAIDPAAQAALQASAAESATATAESVRRIPGFGQWLIDLVPTNPVKAAADGAMLPLIVFTLAFGLAVAGLKGDIKTVVVRVFEAIRDAAMTLVRWILWTAPIGVFALALALVARLGASAIGALAGNGGLVVAVSVIFAVLVLYPVATIIGRVPILAFAMAALPAQSVSVSSRAPLAAPSASSAGAGAPPPHPEGFRASFLPLGASVYRIAAAVGPTGGVTCGAQLDGVSLGPTAQACVVPTAVA